MTKKKRLILIYTLTVAATAAVVLAVSLKVGGKREAGRSETASSPEITDELGRAIPPDHPRARFTDVAEAAGVDFTHLPGGRNCLLPEDMGSGLAWLDYDDDGDDDLFLAQFNSLKGDGPKAPHALFQNDGGRFKNVSEAAGVARAGRATGVCAADADGDGRLDLYLAEYGPNVFFRNRGDGTFEDRSAASGTDDPSYGSSCAWADIDGDGDLDLYAANYVRYVVDEERAGQTTEQYGEAVPFTINPASYEPAPNRLYLNDGAATFTENAVAAGVANEDGRSFTALFSDFNDDGAPDLYIANDVSKNALYENRGDGSFEDVSAQSLSADYRGAMGLDAADFDRDGDFDLFITHWIAQENALYQNNFISETPMAGKLMFMDVADRVGLGAPGLNMVGFGAAFFDYDNDGLQDLFVANGHTFEDPEDQRLLIPLPPQLFWNRGAGGFYNVASVSGPSLLKKISGRGLAVSDYDLDGDPDAAVSVNNGKPLLYNNEGGSALGGWVQLDLRSPGGPNPFAVGARAAVDCAGARQIQEVRAGSSYVSQNSYVLHYGCGADPGPVAAEIRWPDGKTETFADLALKRRHRLIQGAARGGGK